ncbi:choice-of-anchor Q domain-containing protein [Dyadobacter crusticola]|uniref:choice-of-anchor Q domain-containing protein n=1 Tax=Dyadobacter crusticola TaxID=292407 RepID=UPI0004E1502A|nr:choice-of-anchor Q domain-containing protein [Dyadobacter crusticola]
MKTFTIPVYFSARLKQFITVALIALTLAYSANAQTIRYVKQNGSGNGSSWDLASNDLQTTINMSSAGDQVWVAQGEYQPASGQSFSMKERVKILGGFSGTETSLVQRNISPDRYKSILKGNNSRVITNNNNGLTTAAVIDGFTITGGSNVEGGGMYNNYASPFIANCIFTKNSTEVSQSGGGIYNQHSSPVIYNSVFTENDGFWGGAVSASNSSSPKFYNCLIFNNSGSQGTGIYEYSDSYSEFINCTVYNNNSPSGMGGIYIGQGAQPTFRNCIIQNTATYLDRLSYDPTVRTNCLLDQDPLFINVANPAGADNIFGTNDDGLHIQASSPARNAGENAYVSNIISQIDLANNPRVTDERVDIGAYEYFQSADIRIRYVRMGAGGKGYTWETASGDLQAMINESVSGNEVWVAAGEYQPASGQSFSMKEGVKIYGGFPVTGKPEMASRNYAANVTILKGNGASVVSNYNNGLTNAAVLDGFTITGGNATEGGGIYNRTASPLLRNLIIKDNSATGVGGGISVQLNAEKFRLENSLITANSAGGGGGGFHVLNTGDPVLVNVTIAANTASYRNSGGVYVERSNLSTKNCIIWGNKVAGAIANFEGPGMDGISIIQNSLVQGSRGSGSNWNTDISRDGGGNIDADPMFADAENGNFQIASQSAAVNAGNTSLLADAETLKDLANNTRVFGGMIDIGSYENQQVIDASVRYVRQGGIGSGYSWDQASGDLQAMIAESRSGNEVWVAAGEYQPVSGQSFSMKEGVKIYGGFPVTGNPEMASRNYAANVTILKGNGASVVSNYNNGLTNAAVLDGFTITGGNAAEGGGIYNRTASPLLRNLIIRDNSATGVGGGISVQFNSEKFRLENSLITANIAGTGGGGFHVLNTGDPVLVNVTIAANTASYRTSGGVYVERSNLSTRNCIIWGNKVAGATANFEGPGMDGISIIQNSLVQGSRGSGNNWNTDISRDGGGNFDADPLFVDAENGNFAVLTWSPAINAGNNDLLADAANLKDLANNARIHIGTIDMGAYENQLVMDVAIRYVRPGGTGNGYSWDQASGDLRAMIAESRSGNEVWVAAGEYQPASGQSFSMKEGVKIYGGFPVTGNPEMASRNYAANVSILKGNGASVVSNYNNGLTNAAVLDGFTITGGNATEGGGIYNRTASPLLRNLIIRDNSATGVGGGISVRFSSNNFRLENALITSNTAGAGGGGFHILNTSSPFLVNVTITGNGAGSGTGGGVYVERSDLYTRNSIIWGNNVAGQTSNFEGPGTNGFSEIRNSLVQGSRGSGNNWNTDVSRDGGGNIDADPLFVNAENGNFQLSLQSTAINAGDTQLLIDAASLKDLANNARVFGGTIDMGAYENGGPEIRYVRQGGTGNGYNWQNASGDLQMMINESQPGQQVWVAAGEYQPASGQYFSMKEGVKIYGGFANAGDPAFTDRSWNQYQTVLKGNGTHVVRNEQNGLTNAAVLDGFTITSGSADTGGGMLNNRAYPLINHCVFKANHADTWGGGIYNIGPGTTLVANSLFYQNTAQSGAAAFSYQDAKPRFVNVTITDNAAYQNGGAVHNYQDSETELINTIVWGNTQSAGSSQLYTIGAGSSKVYFSVVEGGEAAIIGDKTVVGITSSDPLFTDAPNGNFSLQGCSPAVNIGTANVLSGLLGDLAGNERLYGIVDAGAYEYQADIPIGADRLAANGNVTGVNIEAGKLYEIQVTGDNCRSVAAIESKGASPLSGNVTITTWIDSQVNTDKGAPYVQRHYDISPTSEAKTATAIVTLYYTQAEFDAFNSQISSNRIPSEPQDVAGRANLRVYQYHGSAEGGSGPGSYTEGVTAIDPADTDIQWDYGFQRWKVSFEVTGFSGFFIGSVSSPLPVKLVSFTGKFRDNKTAALEWRVAEQQNIVAYIVEYSSDGKRFAQIASVKANDLTQTIYQYEDAQLHTGKAAYYRLKILEADGSFAFSKVIAVKLAESTELVVYPVPAKDMIWVKAAGLAGSEMQIISKAGVVIKKISVASDTQQIDISTLQTGIYLIRMPTDIMQRFIKD